MHIDAAARGVGRGPSAVGLLVAALAHMCTGISDPGVCAVDEDLKGMSFLPGLCLPALAVCTQPRVPSSAGRLSRRKCHAYVSLYVTSVSALTGTFASVCADGNERVGEYSVLCAVLARVLAEQVR